MSKNFQTEQNELMENLVYNLTYPKFSTVHPHREIALELFITSDCNKKCEYCYL
jgi:sulfatase maturation enzyme AslB (radical SAM superfamily)